MISDVRIEETNRENRKRLFWLEGISDEYLEKVYAASSCLIAASEGEGFGLPLTRSRTKENSNYSQRHPCIP